MKYFVRGIVAVLSVLLAGSALAYVSPGMPTGYVNDYTGTLSQETKATLEGLLTDFQKSGAGELSVVIIPTLNGDSIEEYSITLAREWGIGQQGKNNGTLLLVAKDDRELRIEVGFGNEGTLTDIKSARIIRDIITPRFKEGDYEAGITNGVREIVGVLSPGFVGSTNTVSYSPSSDIPLVPLLGGFAFACLWIASILARSKSWWMGGVIGGVIGIIVSVVFGFKNVGSVALVILVPIGLLFDYIVSKGYKESVSSGTTPPWWTGGGSSGGSSGGSGGFGGFGGGSFGGGGSSGRW